MAEWKTAPGPPVSRVSKAQQRVDAAARRPRNRLFGRKGGSEGLNRPAGTANGYDCLAAEGSEAVRALLEQFVYVRLRPAASGGEVAAAFGPLLECTWLELSALIGPRGTRAVAERALTLAGARAPLLHRAVDVGDDGVSLARLTASLEASRSGDELQAALVGLYLSAMEILCSLIGIDLVQSILRRIASLAALRSE